MVKEIKYSNQKDFRGVESLFNFVVKMQDEMRQLTNSDSESIGTRYALLHNIELDSNLGLSRPSHNYRAALKLKDSAQIQRQMTPEVP